MTLSAALMLFALAGQEDRAGQKDPRPTRRAAPPAAAPIEPVAGGRGGSDERADSLFTVMDEFGRPLLVTGLRVAPGNEFIAEDNSSYIIVSAQDGVALARRRAAFGTADSSRYDETRRGGYAGPLGPVREKTDALAVAGSPLNINPERDKVAIYHTHSDESYTPTDGQSNIPEHGGIYVVGDAFTKALKGVELKVDHDLTAHDPHDSMAYSRSRRTVTKLAGGKPMAMFDVHRDTAPAEAYRRTIRGFDVAQILMVIGQENPSMSANLGFARQLKDQVDSRYPGLIKGIFMGPGDYNQDLYARNLLLEVGSYTNRREEAEGGISLLAAVVPAALGLGTTAPEAPQTKPAAPPASSPAERRGTSRALGWLVGLALVGGAAFLLLSSGGWKQAGARLRNLGSEFDLGRKRFVRWAPGQLKTGLRGIEEGRKRLGEWLNELDPSPLSGRRDRGDRGSGR